MNKFSLLLPIVLFACGSEAAESSKTPAPDQIAAPGAAGSDAVVAPPAATGKGSTYDHDIAAVNEGTTITGGHSLPSITPTPSLPASDPTPIDPSTTPSDPSTTSSDPSTMPSDPSTTSSDPSTAVTDPPTTDPAPTTTDPCAPTTSGHTPNGNSNGTGSQDGEGNSTSACGGPL